MVDALAMVDLGRMMDAGHGRAALRPSRNVSVVLKGPSEIRGPAAAAYLTWRDGHRRAAQLPLRFHEQPQMRQLKVSTWHRSAPSGHFYGNFALTDNSKEMRCQMPGLPLRRSTWVSTW